MKPHDRPRQILLILTTLTFSWLAMMVVHEAGHVLHLLATGGSIEQITLHPLKLSHTLPDDNPRPLATVLGGPLWGVLLPLLLWWIVGRILPTRSYLAAFFAGFCLVANGAYLVGDAILQGGDGREFVQLGVPPWLLVLAGLPLVAAGLCSWNGLGPHFGLGETRGRVNGSDAYAMTALTLALIVAELALAQPKSGPAPTPARIPRSVPATKLTIALGNQSWKSESSAKRSTFCETMASRPVNKEGLEILRRAGTIEGHIVTSHRELFRGHALCRREADRHPTVPRA